MPFPFLPAGAAHALTLLGGAFALFWFLVQALDRAVTSARDAVAPGLVAGLRTWGHEHGDRSGTGPAGICDGTDGMSEGDLSGDEPAGPRAALRPEDDVDEDAGGLAEAEDLPPHGAVPTEAVHRG